MARLRSYGEEARWTSMGTAMVVTLLCCILQCSHAKSVDVGGTAGWTSFDSSQTTAPNYGAWASSQKFFVGDSLVFRFAAGAHNVWQMKSQAAYQSCDFSGATLLDAGDSGFYTWKATYPGGYYFSCDKGAEGVGTHCNYNQKLAILVSKVATPPLISPPKAPSPSPLPSTTTPSPLPLPPSPHSFTAPTPIAKSPVHAPAPAYAPWTASVPAPIPSLSPTKPPILAPSSSPILAPTSSPVLAPTSSPVLAPTSSPVLAPTSSPVLAPSSSPILAPSSSPVLAPSSVPASAPASVISPVSSPSMSPSSGPNASTPLASTPDASSPPMPDLPEVPGGGPASDSPSDVPNAGVLLSVQSWSSLVHSVIALLCMLLW